MNKNINRCKTGKTDISSLLSERLFQSISNVFWKIKTKHHLHQAMQFLQWNFNCLNLLLVSNEKAPTEGSVNIWVFFLVRL